MACETTAADPTAPAPAFEHIAQLTDCAELQSWFDAGWERHEAARAGSEAARLGTAQMEVANDRMREVGCY